MAPSIAVTLRFLSVNHYKDAAMMQLTTALAYTIYNGCLSFLWVVCRGAAGPPQCSPDKKFHSIHWCAKSVAVLVCSWLGKR